LRKKKPQLVPIDDITRSDSGFVRNFKIVTRRKRVKKTNIRYIAFAIAAIVVFATGSGFAQTTIPSNMLVTATVSTNCTFSAGPLAFGAYDPIVTNATVPLAGTATLNLACTSGSPATVALNIGGNFAGGTRRMAGVPSGFLNYDLCQDVNCTTLWGDGVNVGVTKAYTGTGAADTLTVFGRVAAAQIVPAGNYSDTVIASITF
jgi:spore coat protein U-like protein